MESTAGKAPFLGTYISHENVPLAALCAQVAAQSGLTAIQVRAIIEGSFDAIAELEKDGLTIVHLDGLSVWAVITGSFPTGDAAFDPERNALNLAIRLDDSIRLALVNETARASDFFHFSANTPLRIRHIFGILFGLVAK